MFLEDASDIVIQNQSANNIKFKIRISSTETRTLANITSSAILPGLDSVYNLGSDEIRWYQIFADNIAGNLVGDVVGNISGNVKIGKNVFIGTGAMVLERLTICDDVIIGAGAVVNRSITEPGVYVGVPAK
jgi:hypothetical protein